MIFFDECSAHFGYVRVRVRVRSFSSSDESNYKVNLKQHCWHTVASVHPFDGPDHIKGGNPHCLYS